MELTICVGQIEQLSEPIQVKITEWNTGGLLTRIEVCYLRFFVGSYELFLEVIVSEFCLCRVCEHFFPKRSC